MANSSTAAEARKPHKTSDALTARGDGRWCKRYKVNGQWRYWYCRGTEVEALAEWQRVKADLLVGRTPVDPTAFATIADACNRYLTAKFALVSTGELSGRTWISYKKTTDTLVEVLDRHRAIADLKPDDLAELRRQLAAKHGPVTLGREITIVRSVFKHALESDLIERPVKYGPDFKLPSKKAKRKRRNATKREHGDRMFAADEIKRMLRIAGPQLRCMLLLGVNAGLGNTDIASLHLSHIDLKRGWMNYPRPKTEMDRRIPLWPETVKALKLVLANRRQPARPEHAGLVFLTGKRRQPWVRFVVEETRDEDGKVEVRAKSDDAIAKAMRKLLNELGIYRKRVTFYSLRHGFETIAGGCCDQVAVNHIMGHVDNSMAAEYREQIADERLRRVVDHVRDWLFGKEKKAKPKRNSKSKPTPQPATNDAPALRVVG